MIIIHPLKPGDEQAIMEAIKTHPEIHNPLSGWLTLASAQWIRYAAYSLITNNSQVRVHIRLNENVKPSNAKPERQVWMAYHLKMLDILHSSPLMLLISRVETELHQGQLDTRPKMVMLTEEESQAREEAQLAAMPPLYRAYAALPSSVRDPVVHAGHKAVQAAEHHFQAFRPVQIISTASQGV